MIRTSLRRSSRLSSSGPLRKRRKTQKGRIRIGPLDELASKLVRLRDGGRCQRCGSTPKPGGLHAHHIVSKRRYHGTRWDTDNMVSLCYGCHQWAHEHEAEFHVLVGRGRPEGWKEWLQAKAQAAVKVDRAAVREYLREKIREMERR